MARIPQGSEEPETLRLVDARHHFLGLLKGGEVLLYCRQCKRFLQVLVASFHPSSASPAPRARLGREAEAQVERGAEA